MSKPPWSRSWNRRAIVGTLLLVCLFTLHCDDGDQIIVSGTGPFSLTFRLSSDFQQYGGQTVKWALLRSDIRQKLAVGEGTISSVANPSFTLTTGDVMLFGVPHEIHYWIDTNTEGGTPGVCDPVERDEDGEIVGGYDAQWITPFGGATSDIALIAVLTDFQNVCKTFFCGNGVVDPGEECDDGNLADEDGCSASCTVEEPEP